MSDARLILYENVLRADPRSLCDLFQPADVQKSSAGTSSATRQRAASRADQRRSYVATPEALAILVEARFRERSDILGGAISKARAA